MASRTRKGIHFHSKVNSDSEETDEAVIRKDATIEHVMVQFYPNQQLDLHLFLKVEDQHGNTKDIITMEGEKGYLAGDDDKFQWDISVPVQKNDKITVRAVNVDTAGNDYDYVCNMELDRAGGLERIVSNLTGVIS